VWQRQLTMVPVLGVAAMPAHIGHTQRNCPSPGNWTVRLATKAQRLCELLGGELAPVGLGPGMRLHAGQRDVASSSSRSCWCATAAHAAGRCRRPNGDRPRSAGTYAHVTKIFGTYSPGGSYAPSAKAALSLGCPRAAVRLNLHFVRQHLPASDVVEVDKEVASARRKHNTPACRCGPQITEPR
jgi:hypothetical protein